MRAATRQKVLQALAALAVAAAGVASLGTPNCDQSYSLEAEREVTFAADETSRLVLVKFAPTHFGSLTVEVSSGTVFELLEAPIAGQGGSGGAGTGGAAAMAGAVNAGGTPSGTSHAEYGPDGETSEYLFRLNRGSAQGALTARFRVVLRVSGGCGEWDQPEMELRVDVAD